MSSHAASLVDSASVNCLHLCSGALLLHNISVVFYEPLNNDLLFTSLHTCCLQFKCSCSLVNPDAPAVQCELRTRYPTFMCPACGPQHQQADPLVVTTDAEAMPKVDLEHKQSGDYYVYQVSPDHVEAVYTLCSSDGKANLNGLKKVRRSHMKRWYILRMGPLCW